MVHTEAYPQSFLHNQQWGQNPQAWSMVNPQIAQALGQLFGNMGQQSGNYGLGQAAFGQAGGFGTQFGQGGIGPWGQPQGWGGQWQRQLSQQDVGEVVRQLLPLLPHVLAQAQQPQAAYGYGPFSQYGQGPRQLTQQDVNEVVRQILPIVPQIVNLLQGQTGPHAAAIHGGGAGGYGWGGQQGQIGVPGGLFGQGQNPYAHNPLSQLLQQQQPYGYFGGGQFGGGMPPIQAAFGGSQNWGQQRQLSQADVGEVVRQLATVIPQVIANLQAFNQQQQRPI